MRTFKTPRIDARRITLTTVVLFFFIPSVSAQGSSGGGKRPPKPPKPTTATGSTTGKSGTPSKNTGSFIRRKRGGIHRPKPDSSPMSGEIYLSVSEPESEVFLGDANGSLFEQEWNLTPSDNSPLEIVDLEAGTYTLNIRKSGYADETRSVKVAGGQRNSLHVTQRPLAAFLTVTTNVEDAVITIEGLGEFKGKVTNHQVQPGRYRVTAGKPGFMSDSKEVQISRLGEQRLISFDLRPPPTDRLLAEADAEIRAGDFSEAERRAMQVIQFDSSNPKANSIMGLAKYLQGKSDSASYLITAILGSETVSLPVKVLNQGRGDLQLISGRLAFDRLYVVFTPNSGAGSSFRIFKSEVEGLEKSLDKSVIPNVNFKGKGEFGGKKGNSRVYIYSRMTFLRPDRKSTFCEAGSSHTDLCDADMTSVQKLIFDWQNKIR